MQTHGGTPADTAITAPERVFTVRLLADWNNNGAYNHALSDLTGYVKSASTDRSLRGSAPEEILLIEGASAAQLDVTLYGTSNDVPLYNIFSPYQPSSTFWGKDIVGVEITYEIGVVTSVGTVWYPQFIGQVREISPDRASGYVAITALDRAELLRRPVSFPVWGMYEYQRIVQQRIEGQLVESEWVIDHCLKLCDTSSTRWRPSTREENGLPDDDVTGPQLWVSGVGGWAPTVGWMDNYPAQQFPPTETTGFPMYEQEGEPHPDVSDPVNSVNFTGTGDNDDDKLQYWALNRNSITKGGIQVAGFTLVMNGTNSTYYQTVADYKAIDIDLGDGLNIALWIGDSGKFWTVWSTNSPVQTITSPKVTIPTTGDAHRMIVAWDAFNGAGAKVWVQAGSNTSGADWTNTGITPSNTATVDEFKGLIVVERKVPMQDLFWTSTNYGSLTISQALEWAGKQAAYGASLDRGLNRLSFQPSVNGTDAWDIISGVVGSEFGAAFWDEEGSFRFWNRDTVKTKATQIVKDVYLDHVTGLSITNTLDSVRNIWTLTANRQTATFNVLVEADQPDQFYVPALTKRSFRLWIDGAVSIDPGLVTRYTTATWNDLVDFGYVVQWFTGTVWEERPELVSGLEILCYLDEFGQIAVDIYNGYAFPARLAMDSGQPAFRVRGTFLQDQGSQALSVKDMSSIDRFRGRNMHLQGPWYQEFSNYTGLLDSMLTRTSYPIPTTDVITMAGDPRIQLADAISIKDPNGFGANFDVQIYGITRLWDMESGLTDTYAVELSRRPAGVWDDPVMGRWDTSTFIWG